MLIFSCCDRSLAQTYGTHVHTFLLHHICLTNNNFTSVSAGEGNEEGNPNDEHGVLLNGGTNSGKYIQSHSLPIKLFVTCYLSC